MFVLNLKNRIKLSRNGLNLVDLCIKNSVRSICAEFQEQLEELNFVDGARSKPDRLHDCELTTSVEPRSGKIVGEFHLSGADEVNRAVENAKNGLALWKQTSDFEKSRVMQKAAALLRERKSEIVRLDAIDTGN